MTAAFDDDRWPPARFDEAILAELARGPATARELQHRLRHGQHIETIHDRLWQLKSWGKVAHTKRPGCTRNGWWHLPDDAPAPPQSAPTLKPVGRRSVPSRRAKRAEESRLRSLARQGAADIKAREDADGAAIAAVLRLARDAAGNRTG